MIPTSPRSPTDDGAKVVLYQLLSLDGVAEEPGDWMPDGGKEIFDNLGRVVERQDAVLLGRGVYDYWAGYWPTSDLEPFASFVDGTTKHVFTSTESAACAVARAQRRT